MNIDRATKFEDLPDVLLPAECAAYLNLNVRTVRGYIRDGKMHATKCGKQYRVQKQWLAEFMSRASR